MRQLYLRRAAALFLAALATALYIAWPVPFAGARIAWGSQWDLLNNLWFFDYVRKALADFDFSFATDKVFFPFGYDLRLDLIHFMVPLCSVPLQLVADIVIAYNILLILILIFNFYAMYRLAYGLTDGCTPAAIAAAFAFSVSPLVFADMYVGSIELVACGVIPLAISAFWRLWEKGGVGATLAAGGSLVFACLTSWLYGAFTMAALAALAPSYRDWRGLLRWLIAGSGAMILCLPIIAMVVKDDLVGAHLRLDLSLVKTKGVHRDRETFRPPIPITELPAEDLSEIRYSELINDSLEIGSLSSAGALVKPYRAFPHLPLLLFGVVGAVVVLLRRRGAPADAGARDAGRRTAIPAWRWIALGAGAAVLALGPFLQLSSADATRFADHPLPYYYLYQHVPFFTVFYRPHRFVTLMVMALSALLALGIARLARPAAGGERYTWGIPATWLVAASIMIGIAVEFGFSRSRIKLTPVAVDVPEFYRELGRDDGQYGVIELPCAPIPVTSANARYAFYQTVHGKKTYNMTLLRPWHWRKVAELARANRFFAQLLLYPALAADEAHAVTGADLEAFRTPGFRYIIAHVTQPSPTEAESAFCDWLGKLCGPPRVCAGGIWVYDVRDPKAAGARLED